MRSIRATRTSLCALLVIAAACGQDAADRGPRFFGYGGPGPRRGGVLRFSVNVAARTLDPAIAYDEMSMVALHQMADTLIGYETIAEGVGTRLVPQLAERWTVSPDGLSYDFFLRDGIQFSDGRPCRAGDFKYALERVLRTPASPFINMIVGIEGAQELAAGAAAEASGIQVVDDRHLVIRLLQPDATLPFLMAMPFSTPLAREQVESLPPEELRRNLIFTGPFLLESWNEGERLVFRRNPRYWDPDLPYLDGIEIYEAVQRDTSFLRFEAGELETVDRLSSADFVWIAGREDWKPYLYQVPSINSYGERMNCSRPPFDDRRVRQAFNYAVNKEHIVLLQNGRAVVAHGMLPPLMPGYNPRVAPYPHDPARARALLAEAGYPDGFTITYTIHADELMEKVAQSLQSDLAEVGVRVELEVMSWPTFLQAVGKPDGSIYSMASWLMDYPDPSNFIDVKFHSRAIAAENANNDTFYSNPALDDLIDKARHEVDPAARMSMYEHIDELLHDEAPWVWEYHRIVEEVRQPYVMGYAPHPVWNRDYRNTWLDLGPDGKPERR